MSKKKRRKLVVNVVRCAGCNQYKHPKNIMMVDPRIINIAMRPVPICGKCRLRLSWTKVEKNDDCF